MDDRKTPHVRARAEPSVPLEEILRDEWPDAESTGDLLAQLDAFRMNEETTMGTHNEDRRCSIESGGGGCDDGSGDG